MNTMKKNTNLPGFTGYYGSIFEDQDTTSEIDYINEQRKENNLDELKNENDIDWDYDTYYSQLNVTLTNCVEEFLIDLNVVKSIEFIKLHSPKFYNFTNDVIECEIDLNVKEVKKYINSNLDKFKIYLENNYKSRDGFNSFYEHDINFWLQKMKNFKNLDHIEINGILDFICENEEFNLVNHLYNVGFHDIPLLMAANIEELTTNENL
jgi:hypothetical protein